MNRNESFVRLCSFDHQNVVVPVNGINSKVESFADPETCCGEQEPVNLFVYGVVGRDYPKYVCCFGRDV